MRTSKMDKKVCLMAMQHSYKLGMLVAKKELGYHTNSYTREYLVREEQKTESNQ